MEKQLENTGKIRTKEEEDTDEPPGQPPDNYKRNENSETIQTAFDFDPQNLNDMVQSANYDTEEFDIIYYDQYKDNKVVFQKEKCYINDKKEIMLSYLMDKIKRNGMQFNNALISYYDSMYDCYIYCGQDPLNINCTAPQDIIVGNSIEIKVRTKKKNLVDLLLEEQKQKEKLDEDNNFNKAMNHSNQNRNRVKERKIGEVVEKVALWRRFYTGFFDENHNFTSMPLDIAAQKVGISKKTLDDYLLQIRCGKKYGFDFNKNLDQRIGKLRGFVKQQKQSEKKQD